jgi:hypothetical protein
MHDKEKLKTDENYLIKIIMQLSENGKNYKDEIDKWVAMEKKRFKEEIDDKSSE